MTAPEKSVEEIAKVVALRYLELIVAKKTTNPVTHFWVEEVVTQILQTERQKRDAVVDARDKEWKEAIQYLISNSDGTQDWFNGLRACKSIELTQPNNE